MSKRHSTFAVAAVIALSAVAATAQVFAVGEDTAAPEAFANGLWQPSALAAAMMASCGERLAMVDKNH